MTDTDHIIDKSSWPLFTPGLHWALSDCLRNIGHLVRTDDDALEYVIATDDMPDGEQGLWHMNALRDITVDLTDLPRPLRKTADTVALCLGDKTLELVDVNGRSEVTFSMFRGSAILPLFVVDDEVLAVRIQFKGLTDAILEAPRQGLVHATGLLVRIKQKRVPFFVAACPQSTLTWDGHTSHVLMAGSVEPVRLIERHRDNNQMFENSTIVQDESANFEDMWNQLRNSPARPVWSPLANTTVAFMPNHIFVSEATNSGGSTPSATSAPEEGLLTPRQK